MRVLLASLSAALFVLAACGGGTTSPATAVDTECVQGQPFAQRVAAVHDRYQPQLNTLSDRLGRARTLADDHAVFAQVADVLAAEESALQAIPPPAEDRGLVSAVVSADDSMRSAASGLATAGAADLARAQPAFAVAAQNRAEAEQALQLRVEFVQGECSG